MWADTFIYKKHSAINRCQIKTVNGSMWLTIPVKTKGQFQQLVKDIEIDNKSIWSKAFIRSLEVNYQNSPYYYFLADEINNMLKQDWVKLNALLFESMSWILKKMRISCQFIKSGDLPIVRDRSHRVNSWLSYCGCSSYLIFPQEEKLIDIPFLNMQSVVVEKVYFTHPVYHQLYYNFIEFMSAIDLLFNEGEQSRQIIREAVKCR